MLINRFFDESKLLGKRYRRRMFELFGSDRYSRPSLQKIDRKLEKYLNYRNGFFIEVGANDGYTQSNTYYFERFLNWQGILIEPIPELYRQCKVERPNSIVINCALVSEDKADQQVTLMYSNLMSIVKGAMKSDSDDVNHVIKGLEIQNIESTYEVEVQGRSLTSIINDIGVREIDLLSVDVEGYELNVLKGMDMTLHRPKYILIEANFQGEVDEYLNQYDYKAIDNLTNIDILYLDKYWNVKE